MPLFTVTDKAIIDVLSKISRNDFEATHRDFTPGFVEEVRDVFMRFEELGKDFKLEATERQTILAIANKHKAPGDGDVVSYEEVLPQQKNFDDKPDILKIYDGIVERFLAEVSSISVPFANHEFALRFYVGHEIFAGTEREYSVVVVPICSPEITVPGEKRDHSLDLENKLSFKYPKFYALTISNEYGKGYHDGRTIWRKIINGGDHMSDTKLGYFSLEQFSKFRNGADPLRRETMVITFGRKVKGLASQNSIKMFVSFLAKGGGLIESTFFRNGFSVNGAFLDQNDLIPPPFPVSDPSF